MPKSLMEQPAVVPPEVNNNNLLSVHRTVLENWFLNWQIEQDKRLQKLMGSRTRSKSNDQTNASA
jgi:hypothetical protein